jgi:hypothetical protein
VTFYTVLVSAKCDTLEKGVEKRINDPAGSEVLLLNVLYASSYQEYTFLCKILQL